MSSFYIELHSVYGAIPRDGEYVEPGDVLGFSSDAKEVVTAPIGGWVRLINTTAIPYDRLHIQILAQPGYIEDRGVLSGAAR